VTGISATLVLNVGRDSPLLDTRAMLLRSAGYIVESTPSMADAIHRFRTGDFDLVILCHSIPEQDRQRLIDLIREEGSSTPVIFISSTAAPPTPRFAVLSVDNHHPAALLSAIRELLSQKQSQE
jgi:CheY-like chemotaxis protein